ncbi:tRNA pseudouridine synthase A [Pedobacter arcticus]|uniref:tRNA pseudouridine synthase A n=1 Tax=Pedobacter arcticus TaxID=752140 RepID=UPI0002F30FEB|nr:tRNA pseudouridine synthase A [Pedobacter arcticus]
MRYFFHIGYRGANYHGWQRNAAVISLQQVIEEKISQVLKIAVTINGCGRTDAHVNASQYFFHADFKTKLNENFFFLLNQNLPDDIAVFDIIPMDALPHARFDAIQRRYDYFIHTYKDPFLSICSSQFLDLDLDFDKLRQATLLLTKYSDYRSFCTSPDKNTHTICDVAEARWLIKTNGKQMRFQISSNRFLRKMIRIIIGQLIKVGTGKLSVADFENHLINKETPKVLSAAPPQGLYLSKVTYPYLDLEPKTQFMGLDFGDDGWERL